MKRLIKRFTVLALALIIAVPVMTSNVAAASTVSISAEDQVSGGEVFAVTVTFDGDSIGRVIGNITYDTDMLSYISGGSSSGNVGYVELKQAGIGEALTFNLQFQALKEGSATLSVSASEMYDLDEMYMDTPSASKTITINGNADAEDIVEETTIEDDPADDEGLSVDEKDEADVTDPIDNDVTTDPGTGVDEEDGSNSGSLAKYLMLGIGALILILLIAMILRRRK